MGHTVNNLYQFLSGAAMFGAWVVGAFFFRFWRKTRDRLFLHFGIAFWIMAFERLLLICFSDAGKEDRSLVYLIRLVAFLIILFAIADKNRKEVKAEIR